MSYRKNTMQRNAVKATPVPGALPVISHGTFPDNSADYLEVACDSYKTFSQLPGAVTLDGYSGVFGKSAWNSDTNKAVYRTDKPVATAANTKIGKNMAKKLPEKIKHKGHIYVRADAVRTADLGTSLQSDVTLINQVMQALQAGNLSKEDAIDKLGDLKGAAKGILDELSKIPGLPA